MNSNEIVRKAVETAAKVTPVIGPAVIAGGLALSGGEAQANPHTAPQATPTSRISGETQVNQNPFASNIAAVDTRSSFAMPGRTASEVKERRAMSLAETFSNLNVSAAEVEAAGVSGLDAVRFTKDSNGNVTEMYAIDSDRRVKISTKDASGKFGEWKAATPKQAPAKNLHDVIMLPDGTIIAGGEKELRTGEMAINIWRPGATDWEVVPAEVLAKQSQATAFGTALGLQSIPGRSDAVMINIGATESAPGMAIFKPGSTRNSSSIVATGVTGESRDVVIRSATATEIQAVSAGKNGQDGFFIHNINPDTGAATSTQVREVEVTVEVNGQKEKVKRQLGYLFGTAVVDGKMLTADRDAKKFYTINLADMSATEMDTSTWLQGKGIENYRNSTWIKSIAAHKNSEGETYIIFGAQHLRTSRENPVFTETYAGVGVFKLGDNPTTNPSALQYREIHPNLPGTIKDQDKMAVLVDANNNPAVVVTTDSSITVVPLTSKGKIDESVGNIHAIKGFAGAGDVTVPEKYRVVVPFAPRDPQK